MTEAARKWLAQQGYDPLYGARPLRRAMQKYVEGPLSVQLLQGRFKSGHGVVVDAEGDGIVFRPKEEAPVLPAETPAA